MTNPTNQPPTTMVEMKIQPSGRRCSEYLSYSETVQLESTNLSDTFQDPRKKEKQLPDTKKCKHPSDRSGKKAETDKTASEMRK